MGNFRYLIPGFRLDKGFLGLKFLGLEVNFYWPCEDWSFGIDLGFFGHGIACHRSSGIWLWQEEYEDFWQKQRSKGE